MMMSSCVNLLVLDTRSRKQRWLGGLKEKKGSSLQNLLHLNASDGLHWLGWCCARGNGCERDLEKARECFQIAAQLGFVSSMRFLGNLLDESYPQRWIWWGRAAVLRDPSLFLENFSGAVLKLISVLGMVLSCFKLVER
jgi:TPR repeat protein